MIATDNGHLTYQGSTLYQCSDLEPELDIMGRAWTTRIVHVTPENGKLAAAAKIIRGNEPAARFNREINALHMVRDHPSFVQLIGVVDQSPMRYVLEEFVGNDFIPENPTLRDVLNDNKIKCSEIPRREWLQIAKDIADGIQHLHQQNYIHVNIKPENILLCATNGSWRGWRPKICDLEDTTSAKLAPKINSTLELRPTAEEAAKPFVAPEVLRVIGRKAKIGKKCDRVFKWLQQASSQRLVHFFG